MVTSSMAECHSLRDWGLVRLPLVTASRKTCMLEEYSKEPSCSQVKPAGGWGRSRAGLVAVLGAWGCQWVQETYVGLPMEGEAAEHWLELKVGPQQAGWERSWLLQAADSLGCAHWEGRFWVQLPPKMSLKKLWTVPTFCSRQGWAAGAHCLIRGPGRWLKRHKAVDRRP